MKCLISHSGGSNNAGFYFIVTNKNHPLARPPVTSLQMKYQQLISQLSHACFVSPTVGPLNDDARHRPTDVTLALLPSKWNDAKSFLLITMINKSTIHQRTVRWALHRALDVVPTTDCWQLTGRLDNSLVGCFTRREIDQTPVASKPHLSLFGQLKTSADCMLLFLQHAW